MHFKQNNKESRSYLQGLRPFKNVIPKNLKRMLNKKGYAYSEIVGKWTTLVGKNISEISFPKSIKVTNEKEGGILTLAVKRGDEIDIEYSKKIILDKINSYFGYRLLNKIKLETFNYVNENKKNKQKFFKNNSTKFSKLIEEIDSEKIKKSLYKMISEITK